MYKTILISKFLLLVSLMVCFVAKTNICYSYSATVDIKVAKVYKGYWTEKIWLKSSTLPKITISNVVYEDCSRVPADAIIFDSMKFDILSGIERKKPFIVVRVPVYYSNLITKTGTKKIRSFNISFSEPTIITSIAAKTTSTASSVLATGSWFKIAITQTGLYKIDRSFIASLGVDPENLDPANIRIYGNGGNMLSEDNAVKRPYDLIENAVFLNANGDAKWDNSDFVIFYGTGTTKWYLDSTDQFRHVQNLYSDTAYYFICFDRGPGLRVQPQTIVGASNKTVTNFNYYDVYEKDKINPVRQGKAWYGEQFSEVMSTLKQQFPFDIGSAAECVKVAVSLASTSSVGGSGFSISINGNNTTTTMFTEPTTPQKIMNISTVSLEGGCGSQMVNIGIDFISSDISSIGYLNYIEVNARRSLFIDKAQLMFRDVESVGNGIISAFQLQGATSETRVWDVTDAHNPVEMSGSLQGSTYTFNQDASILHEYIALNNFNLFTPKYVGKTANQNLHGMPQCELLIVCHHDFIEQANKLAEFHRQHDKMSVVVTTVNEIYNEFSSGGQDISAIRDFVKMFYDRAGSDSTQMPKYLQLFGCGSYDYKNRAAANCNYVPVFESANSIFDDLSFSSDDFYGFLDSSENIENNLALNTLDIGIGRIPARNTTDANNFVEKVINYKSSISLGEWRINATLVADDGCNDPAGNFLVETENVVDVVTSASNGLYNYGKVYVDAIPKISTPAGARSPNANISINNQINKGTFWINYIGHGNPNVWAGERILSSDDYRTWKNGNKLPFMITGTCDFGQFDQPEFVSSGEEVVLYKNAGVIVNFTTTKAVYSFFNNKLNSEFLNALFLKNGFISSTRHAFGDAVTIGKNATYIQSTSEAEIANFRKFVLLGDPALEPNFPQYNITMDTLIDNYTKKTTDSVKALGEYVIIGHVRDADGNILEEFSGILSVTFFDKYRTVNGVTGCGLQYDVRDNVIYKGKAKVTKGQFSFSFIAPKDINYKYGTGKLSTYAHNGVIDAAGIDTTLWIGGFSDNPVLNDNSPIVKAYIGDTLFRNGGITGNNTSIFASFSSVTGINISGNSVGHDITAILDDQTDNVYVLNDYYETEEGTYQKGYLSFPLTGLSNGLHKITIRAWDINNNMGEGETNFWVVDGSISVVQQLMNYPNPFKDITRFIFEFNHPAEKINLKINIFSLDGKQVKTIYKSVESRASTLAEIDWDGTDINGFKLPAGMYLYRLILETSEGIIGSAYNKLIIDK